MINRWCLSYKIAHWLMSLDLTDDKSTLVYVMAWCCQATSHYMSQCWPRFMSPYGVTRPQWVKSTENWHLLLLSWARFLSLARSELRLCSANHRAGYFSNLACDWLSIVWAYSNQKTENRSWSGPWFNIKMSYYQHRKSHFGDETVTRSSNLHNRISYSGKTPYLYRIVAQRATLCYENELHIHEWSCCGIT